MRLACGDPARADPSEAVAAPAADCTPLCSLAKPVQDQPPALLRLGTSPPLASLCWQRKARARSIDHRASLPPHSLGGAISRASFGPRCSLRTWRNPVLASACRAPLGTAVGTARALLCRTPFAWRLACPVG